MIIRAVALLAALLLVAPSARTQEHAPAPAARLTSDGDTVRAETAEGPVDIITPHITDSYDMELPYWKPPFAKHVCLGRHLPNDGCGPLWDDVGHIGPLDVNFSPSKHVVMMLLAALLTLATLLTAAKAHARHHHEVGRPKGFAAGIEAMVLYLRNEVVVPNVGPHGEKFAPFILTLFFFILFANLLGLIPYGATATGNISVTATLAIVTFIVVEIAGMRALGKAYINTIIYWPHDQSFVMKAAMTPIMTPVEIMSKFTKPFALAIRLFANMTAGHVVVLALISLIFTFGNWWIAGVPVIMALAIMMLEIFVSFLQAFVFALLASVFIGQVRVAHH
jgi:F-type H+-transporting ATPase subunit a